MNRSMKTKIMCWFCVLSVVCATQLYADENNSPKAINQSPYFRILDKWRGNWRVTARFNKPNAKTVTYDEHYDWVMNGRFLRGETSQQPDGNTTMMMMWYEENIKSYRILYFFSKPTSVGLVGEPPPATWNEQTQTMEANAFFFGFGGYTGRETFLNKDTIKWNIVVKDWKGVVTLDMEGTNIRRK